VAESPTTEARRALNARLPARTLVGFVAATVAVLLILVLSYRSYEERYVGVHRLTRTLTVHQRIESLIATITNAETGQRGYLLTGSESYLEPYNTAIFDLPRTIEATRQLVADDPSQARRLERLEILSTEKLAELKDTIELRRANRTDAALLVVKENHGKDLMDRMRVIVDEMKAAERLQLEQRTSDWEAAAARSILVTSLGSALLLFLIVGAAFMTSKDFREQQVQSWLRAGQSDLGLRLQGEKSIETLGDEVVRFLATYLGARLAAVYVERVPGVLKRIGGYALPTGIDPESSAGLTRQALQDNKIVTVTDVPSDFFPISTGIGSRKPQQLVIAPISASGKPFAVVELGFFRAVDEFDLELLGRLSESIGIALRSSRYRSELQDLLEETQRQAEELQTQQEELRVNNEELEQQSRTLQQSEERLRNQQAELEVINTQLEEQTQSLSTQRDDLAKAQVELQRASAYKSEFLANMSHELRTPLNSTLILAKLLADNPQGNLNPEQVKFARTIYSAGNDLLTLINDILDLSRIEAGKLVVRPEDVGLPRLVDDLALVFQPLAKDKHLDLDLAIEAGVAPTLHTDPTRLQQILTNLLSNAIKFTERGGVALRIRRGDDGGVAFEVKDTGIGIPRDQQDVIFEAFRQADGTTNRKYGGTGLGLSISRDLARLLGGELTVESGAGRGSTFTLTLPKEAPAGLETAREKVIERAAPLRPKAASRPPSTISLEPSAVADDRETASPGGRAILVVEDDLPFAKILVDLAHELDFKALVAHTAEQGLAMAARYRPNAIVLDVGLPDRSGLSVLDALKHDPALRHIPVHVMSVSDYTQTALAMGAAGYAIKPVKRDELVSALKHLEAKFTQQLRRVLVVEDDEVHRESTSRLLAADDVETVAVGTAAEALEQLGRSTFDCMVLDLSLPDRTGFDLLGEMAAKEQYSFPPVIVYTGRSLSRTEEQQLRRFSNSIIIKGARSPERLLDEVTLFLHQVESKLPPDRQRMLRAARDRDVVFEGRRVLVVEDDVRNIFALSSVLEPKGARVEIARNGREALDHLANDPGVDLVLMDIMMPEMDGLEAIREIRKKRELSKLPIIALTAKAMADDRENALSAGANDYLAKPLDVDKLLSLARVWMRK
jgi:signal transduction histidine kinase/DNA-binding response OmpR family regulator/CHASE3 domain sensor protein